MRLKTLLFKILIVLSGIYMMSCNSFDEVKDVEKVATIAIELNVTSSVPNIVSMDGLQVKLTDMKTGAVYSKTISGNNVEIDDIIPGIYSIDVWGDAYDTSHDLYMLSGNKLNFPLISSGEKVDINVAGYRESILLFKEIYYAGSRTPLNASYFRDQFYEIYNNSEDQTIYLDGIYFANLTPAAATTNLPLWPESDGDRFVYADRIWKFPGTGTEYPLGPGESFIVSQYAVNHQLSQFNPNSPINASSSEFEFHMYHANFPDQPAVNMDHVFYNGSDAIGTMTQYLTSVFGGAYVLFKPLSGEQYAPAATDSLKAMDLSKPTSKSVFAKIPRTYIIDAVEAGDNESKLSAKRMPASLDKGMTYVGATYCALGVARKQTGTHANGTPILQDTNDSTEDFDRKLTPMFRRYNSLKPSWSQSN